MRRLALILLALVWASCAQAQNGQPVTTFPAPQSTVNVSGTISVTDTFQEILPSKIGVPPAQLRHNCSIQNNGSHTMYVFFGPIASATEAKSFQVAPSGTIYCGGPVSITAQDQVSITGTSGEAFTATWD